MSLKSAVDLVLLDAREHPVKLARRDLATARETPCGNPLFASAAVLCRALASAAHAGVFEQRQALAPCR